MRWMRPQEFLQQLIREIIMAKSQTEMFEFEHEPIKGYPELRWAGKRPFTGTSYYPAQLKETHGEAAEDGWINKLYWGDNLQVMSHLLKKFRGQVNLIYIDPPFDSRIDYKKTITLRGCQAVSERTNFEEKQYGDIWLNDEYLQFLYERLILCRELLSSEGSLYLHCDWHKSHLLRTLMDEVFGPNCFRNSIAWKRGTVKGAKAVGYQYARNYDVILYYSKTEKSIYNRQFIPYSEEYIKQRFTKNDNDGRGPYTDQAVGSLSKETIERLKEENRIFTTSSGKMRVKQYLSESDGIAMDDIWIDIPEVNSMAKENTQYPTQKPEPLIERIIKTSSNPGDIVFDCFMGSGTTQAVAMKLGRKFIGADINLGAVQTATKRLIARSAELNQGGDLFDSSRVLYTGFEVYNVNDYEFFRNELEAKKLIIEALGMQLLPENNLWDAELDGRMVAILGINRIATASEFEKIVANIDISGWQKKQNENPGKPVEKITFVCMGHDPNLEAMFHEKMASLGFVVDLEIIDILRDKKELTFKRDADAKISIANGKLSIEQFYPMNLLQKLSFEKQDVEDWKELVDSVMIDWNYDGVAFAPALTDIPEKDALVKGVYDVPEDAGTIHVKITDLISESWEGSFSIEGSKL